MNTPARISGIGASGLQVLAPTWQRSLTHRCYTVPRPCTNSAEHNGLTEHVLGPRCVNQSNYQVGCGATGGAAVRPRTAIHAALAP